ncbi:hypothetical protein [uncultured Kordia sp.]|uniref:hypothetical protein n=1 Tax=uncultured Kordia sp. TaxID=507699 RepID=UPI00261FCE03|nr:hypothetical protein [uncultured Kordia sp.]
MNPVIEYLKKIVVVNIIFLFVSCSLLKSQEQKTLDDIKQIAKIHFENQFQINKNSKRGKNDTFIYFSINQEDNFKTFFEEDKIKQYIKDSGVYKKLFNEKELINYRNQAEKYDLESIREYVTSDKLKPKPITEEIRETILKKIYFMNTPVFNIDKTRAIFLAGVQANYVSIIVYKKHKKKWDIEHYFLIGFS